MTPVKTDPVEERTRALLEREEQDRADRARETARQQLEREDRDKQIAAAVEAAETQLRAMDPRTLEHARDKATSALEEYAAELDAWNKQLAAIRDPWLSNPHPDVTTELNGTVAIGDATARRVGLQSAIASLAREVLAARFPREYVLLDNPTDQ